MVLQKVGLRKKKGDKHYPLIRTNDLPHFELDLFCEKPKEYFYTSDRKVIPKIVSRDLLRDKKELKQRSKDGMKEKW